MELTRRYQRKIAKHAKKRTDISDHLISLFKQTIASNPKLIVEIGIRSGESSFVFNRAAIVCDSFLVGVDIDDCSSVYKKMKKRGKRKFIKGDDIEIGKSFQQTMKSLKYPTTIDVLFIDTSHLYDHTVKEINTWFPLLSKKCTVIFHDTNLKPTFKRKDGTLGRGWDNERGVIRALEEFLNTKFNEDTAFHIKIGEWQIIHIPYCNGLTILKRL